MNSKKLTSLMLTCLITAGVAGIGTSTANATELENNQTNKNEIIDIQPRIAGLVRVTSTSGAYIRSGAGTNYRVVATANYGAFLVYQGKDAKDSNGVVWYKVASENGRVIGWISSQVGQLG